MPVLRRLAGAVALVALVLITLSAPGPVAGLAERRVQVQEFARSLAGDLPLNFEWAPRVGGYGGPGSYGGRTEWNTAHGGYATMTLSDSIAADWHRNPELPSLVAHEVGHAMTARCVELFVETFDSDGEAFATAWAISLGFDGEGSGETLYGRPPNGLIAAAKTCR